MTDLASATIKAIHQKLVATITDVPVYQHPPENLEPPYVIIAGLAVSDEGGKGDSFERHQLTIEAYIREPQVLPLHQLLGRIKAALKDQAVSQAEASLSPPSFLSADDVLMEDGETYAGVIRFELFAQPLF